MYYWKQDILLEDDRQECIEPIYQTPDLHKKSVIYPWKATNEVKYSKSWGIQPQTSTDSNHPPLIYLGLWGIWYAPDGRCNTLLLLLPNRIIWLNAVSISSAQWVVHKSRLRSSRYLSEELGVWWKYNYSYKRPNLNLEMRIHNLATN